MSYDYVNTLEKRYEVEAEEEWKKHMKTMPFVELKDGYSFKCMPPFAGAMFRFFIKHSETQKEFSIYFDEFERLGIYGGPYFEVYPIENDIFRSDNIEDIMNAIYNEIDNLKK